MTLSADKKTQLGAVLEVAPTSRRVRPTSGPRRRGQRGRSERAVLVQSRSSPPAGLCNHSVGTRPRASERHCSKSGATRSGNSASSPDCAWLHTVDHLEPKLTRIAIASSSSSFFLLLRLETLWKLYLFDCRELLRERHVYRERRIYCSRVSKRSRDAHHDPVRAARRGSSTPPRGTSRRSTRPRLGSAPQPHRSQSRTSCWTSSPTRTARGRRWRDLRVCAQKGRVSVSSGQEETDAMLRKLTRRKLDKDANNHDHL